MSDRKESLKKSLGITDYPWSSDDDAEPEPTLRQEHSTPEQNNMVRLMDLQRPTQDASTEASPFAGHPGVPLTSTSSQASTELRRQDNEERDFIWTFINRQRIPPRPTAGSRPSSSSSTTRLEVPLSLVTRSHSSIDGRARDRAQASRSSRASADVRRVIAIGRLNRAYRHNKSATQLHNEIQVLRNSGQPNRESPTVSMGRRLLEVSALVMRRRNTERGGPTLNQAVLDEPGPSTSAARAPSGSNEPVNIDHSDEDVDVEMPPAVMSPTLPDNDDDDNDLDASTQTSRGVWMAPFMQKKPDRPSSTANGASGDVPHNVSAVSMEEEIVEIDAEPEPEAGDTEPTAVVATDAVAKTEEANCTANSAAVQTEAHGVKRKRDEYDDGEPDSVREFNQSLLRLLECPVCLEWMEPPISQCRRGHLVCGRCRARLSACPVCRTAFSSVRNRAMEGVAEMIRYPCRHGCGREVRLRKRGPHESSCAARRYRCPASICHDKPLYPHADLSAHFQARHISMLKFGRKHQFQIKVNTEQHDNWVIMTLHEMFHLRVDVDIRSWGVVVYVAYIGPKRNAENYTYEVTVSGQHNSRKLVYTRSTHCDLECSSLNVSRQDCFHLTLDQALNFMNRHCEPDKFLSFAVEISKCEQVEKHDSDA